MPSRSADPLAVELWLDYDPAVRALPGTALGVHTVTGPAGAAVADWHRRGARCVRLPEPVRLCADASGADLRALLLLREATARGLAVLWEAHCPDGCVTRRLFHHFYPPTRVHGQPAEVAGQWRAAYFPNKCVHRRGPGFAEVRDRRGGRLELYTVDETEHLAAIAALTPGVPAAELPAAALRDFTEAGLVAEQAGLVWWLPLAVRRWPFPSLTV
ncbi:DUF5825 family protein [Kitasatospora sp. NPDC002227]|uniref:DUF5825 family protein n=1 Tax=Kitasatospora sp. NPDC002227 TaxID=3154773 RepID=UPI003321B191